MNIISSEEKNNRLIDGIRTILSLPDDKYNLFIQKMIPQSEYPEKIHFYYQTDKCECPQNPIQLGLETTFDENNKYISRSYYGGKNFEMNQILEQFHNMQNNFPKDSLEYSRINEIINTRNLNSYITYYSNEKNINPAILEKAFQMLCSQDILSKFLDYDNNKDTFAVDGIEIPIQEYLKPLGDTFGNKDSAGNLSTENYISKDFLIPNLDEYKKRYSKIFDEINIDKYVNPKYTFSKGIEVTDTIIRDGEEPYWEISPNIREEIFNNMPKDFSLEEQAMYIYCKMCTIFCYDEGYLYRDKLNKVNYDATFSKKHLENIQPNDKITCYDFSRMYAKLINELDGNINAVVILTGANDGHALTGFYTDKVSATAEAINISSSKDATNDLMKAQNGINLKGITAISDRNNILNPTIEKVYSQIIGKKPQTIKEFIAELKSLPQEETIQNDVFLKLQCFIETMKSNNIYGNEFTQTLWGISHTTFFGEDKLDKAYLGELQKDENGNERYKRHILLRRFKV